MGRVGFLGESCWYIRQCLSFQRWISVCVVGRDRACVAWRQVSVWVVGGMCMIHQWYIPYIHTHTFTSVKVYVCVWRKSVYVVEWICMCRGFCGGLQYSMCVCVCQRRGCVRWVWFSRLRAWWRSRRVCAAQRSRLASGHVPQDRSSSNGSTSVHASTGRAGALIMPAEELTQPVVWSEPSLAGPEFLSPVHEACLNTWNLSIVFSSLL